MLNDVEFREVQEIAKVSKVKVVACDGKGKLLNNFYALFCVVNLFFIIKSHEKKKHVFVSAVVEEASRR